MDDFDRAILSCLKEDGRMSYQDIGHQVGLSISSVARRVQAMEAAEIIQGYTARINEEMVGFGFPVFVSVRLERQLASNFAYFEEKIKSFPEVVECWLMTGTQDYLLKLNIFEIYYHFYLNTQENQANILITIALSSEYITVKNGQREWKSDGKTEYCGIWSGLNGIWHCTHIYHRGSSGLGLRYL